MKKMNIKIVILFCVIFAATGANAQTNLLLNSNADFGLENWHTFKQTVVEDFNETKVFVVRNGGHFVQDVNLTETDIGKFVLLIGRGSSERINVDGAITGLPCLYGYMMSPGERNSGRIYSYLQGQKLRGDAQTENEWVTMFGIFQVPEGTGRICFFLNQAERRGVPHNGSAARFSNLGLYLFETEEDALEFARAYK